MIRSILITTLGIIVMLWVSLPVRADSFSCSPLRLKTGFTEGGQIALDWGMRLEDLRLTFHGDFPDRDYSLRLEFFQALTKGWDGETWGMIKKEGNYTYDDYGFRTQADWGPIFTSFQWTNHHREALADAVSGGYDGEDGQWRGVWKHGNHRMSLSLSRSIKEYDKGDGDFCRDQLLAGWQWTDRRQRLEVQWSEWTKDYPQDASDNLLGEKIIIKWRTLGDKGKVREVKGEWREEHQGDGETVWQQRVDFHTTRPFFEGTLRWGLVWTGKSEAIELLEQEDWNKTWRGDLRWQKTLGHRRSWWIGGDVQVETEDNAEWTVKTQWDWPIKSVGVRLLISADYQDGDWEAGAHALMTYYF